jgi:hypothetical protein
VPDDVRRLIVRIDDDHAGPEQLDELAAGLRDHLRGLGDERTASGEPAPPGTRAVELAALGTVVVTLLQSDVLAAVVSAVTAWLGNRRNRTVRLELDGDVLELTGVPTAEQRRLTDAWLTGKWLPTTSTGTRQALIVAAYQFADSGLSRLRAPAHDAEALARVLEHPGIGNFAVTTLINEPAPVVAEAIEDFFADRSPEDLLLLHFSGHGVKDVEGELYLATSGTKLNRLAATAVSADFVNRRMSRSRSRRIVLLLDCCYAGAFGRGMVPRAGRGMDVQDHFGGRGRAVITASNATEYAFEGADVADSDPTPSVFTSALVEGLQTGDADLDQDGYVGLDELYEYVYDRVRRTTPSQTPGKWTFDVQGDLRIARRGRPVTVPAALPAEVQAAVDSPLAAVRSGAVVELARLTRARHGGLALAARVALRRLAEDDSRSVAAAATAALDGDTEPTPEIEPTPVTAALDGETENRPVSTAASAPPVVAYAQPEPPRPRETPIPRQPGPDDADQRGTVPATAARSAAASSPAAASAPARGRVVNRLAVAAAAAIGIAVLVDAVAAPEIYQHLPAFGHPAVSVLIGLWLILLLASALVLAAAAPGTWARRCAWAGAATTAGGLLGALGTIVGWAPDAIPMLWLVFYTAVALTALAAVVVDVPAAGPRLLAYASAALFTLMAAWGILLPKLDLPAPTTPVALTFLALVLVAQLSSGLVSGRAGASWPAVACGVLASVLVAANALTVPDEYAVMLPLHVAPAGVVVVGAVLLGEQRWQRLLCLRTAVIIAMLIADDYVNSSSDFDGIRTAAATVVLAVAMAAATLAAAWLSRRHGTDVARAH